MAFIPIVAKSDIIQNGTAPTATLKKGKITPAQMAQAFAWTFPKKVGILNCLDKCECENRVSTINPSGYATITFKSGYIVIYGRLIQCESGTAFSFNPGTTGNGKIILSINLAQTVEKEVQLVRVDQSYELYQEDINEKPIDGKYDFELYQYSIENGTVTFTRRGENFIFDIESELSKITDNMQNDVFGTGTIGTGSAPLQGYDKTKGTVEERLTALGFKEATIGSCNADFVSSVTAFTQGQVVALVLKLKGKQEDHTGDTKNVVNVNDMDLSFIPEDGLEVGRVVDYRHMGAGYYRYYSDIYKLYPSGEITFSTKISENEIDSKLSGGFIRTITPTKTIFESF